MKSNLSSGLFGVRVFALLVLIVGAVDLWIGAANPRNAAFLIIGVICAILAVGLFKLWNWARVATIALSFAFILLVYVPLIMGTIRGYWQNFGGLGLVANFPVLILCLLCINSLMRPEIREIFMRKDPGKEDG